ncbi:hypothetical protein BDV24DRAFT_158125 [Aspergillus arachidicola]|uniref:Homeobox domain-containing protein n=1 Tax=Aspergillus arachidicola TaxID=656916 RepID=A0A5N6YP00_9EURO|nr:hypothetical protein BDV24DRAFT_158125 [Aspergillus arachidicola]
MVPTDDMSFNIGYMFPESEASPTHATDAAFPHESRTALGSPRLKRGTSTFSQDQLNVLEQWPDLNLHCPYPTKEEKRSLAGPTGLSISQVSTWFTNARRRLRQTRSAFLLQRFIDTRISYFSSGAPVFGKPTMGVHDPT